MSIDKICEVSVKSLSNTDTGVKTTKKRKINDFPPKFLRQNASDQSIS
jgi:hypothetical protein